MRSSRRTRVGSACAVAALGVVMLPYVATAKPVEVDGDRLRSSGLVRLTGACNDVDAEPAEPPTFLVKRGPGKVPIGQYSSGWKVDELGFGAGSAAVVTSPTSLSQYRIALNVPAGEALGAAVVIYHPPSDDGYWVGLRPLEVDTERGWHPVNALNRVLSWEHYLPSGTPDRTGAPATVVAHTTTQGGDGEGAEIGFIFGCNGKAFYVDRLRVASEEDELVFDYGGFRTRVEQRLGDRKPKRTEIVAGKALTLKGSVAEEHTRDSVAGTLQWQARPLSRRRWDTFERVPVRRREVARLEVQPTRNTAYRVVYPGTATRYEGDESHVLKVVVRMSARASFVDPTVQQGEEFVVVGRVVPGKRTDIALQRLVDGSWRTARSGSTSSGGSFRLAGTAQEVGISRWRVRVSGGATNADGVSPTFQLTVTQPPPPPDDPPDDPPPPEG